ncbi:tetratricopeptide repeat protein [Microvirga sp. W0021]|uniref:Tetratricopeptide repeat protein n=1 Tax=Hohaiivirga grylli TaxID=3133970 RepID=A0ABV0BK61_9HYPH
MRVRVSGGKTKAVAISQPASILPPESKFLFNAAAVFLAATFLYSAPSHALEVQRQGNTAKDLPVFSSVKEAVRAGVRDYNSGDKAGAAQALQYAATQGHSLALWKLGRMYADGDGVPRDDLKAFEYFSKLADENAEENPGSANAAVVSSAFVALGTYFLDGIKGTYVESNPARAYDMFHYAASYFSDPNAQYSLARLYIDGNGCSRDPRQAARWLNLAAEKGHYPSQALLGHLLVNGTGVPKERVKGLMWLSVAYSEADPVRDQWIVDLYERALSGASASEQQAALEKADTYRTNH